MVANGGVAVPPCTDNYEPNDTQATAFGNVVERPDDRGEDLQRERRRLTTRSRRIDVAGLGDGDGDRYAAEGDDVEQSDDDGDANDRREQLGDADGEFFPTLSAARRTTPIFVRVEANGTVGATRRVHADAELHVLVDAEETVGEALTWRLRLVGWRQWESLTRSRVTFADSSSSALQPPSRRHSPPIQSAPHELQNPSRRGSGRRPQRHAEPARRSQRVQR